MSANAFLAPSPVVPTFLVITAITNASPCQVTVNTPNAYIPGQIMRFSVPSTYGMTQINGLQGQVLSVDNTNLIFQVEIDTNQFDVFAIPSPGPFVEQPATISPAGSRNTYNFTVLPFHSLNGGIGN